MNIDSRETMHWFLQEAVPKSLVAHQFIKLVLRLDKYYNWRLLQFKKEKKWVTMNNELKLVIIRVNTSQEKGKRMIIELSPYLGFLVLVCKIPEVVSEWTRDLVSFQGIEWLLCLLVKLPTIEIPHQETKFSFIIEEKELKIQLTKKNQNSMNEF